MFRTSASGRTTCSWKLGAKDQGSRLLSLHIIAHRFIITEGQMFRTSASGRTTVLAALVALLKFGSHHVPGLLLLHGILQQLLVQVCLVEADVNRVPSGH